jgi:hypothetical protein
MGMGVAAFEQAAEAQTLAAELGGMTRTFDELMADPPGKMMH